MRGLATLFATLVGALMVTTLPVGVASAAGPSGGACQLQGVANLTPGLTSSSQAFNYSFTGNLSGCQSNIANAPTTGTVSAGIQLRETVTLSSTTSPPCPGTPPCTTTGTVSYQEPTPSGNGSCGSSTTAGSALVQWADGTTTATTYTTSGALAAVSLQGAVDASMTLSLVASSVPAGWTAPGTFTINTTRFTTADTDAAALTFSPTTQQQDCVTTPVTAANINGAVGIGTPS